MYTIRSRYLNNLYVASLLGSGFQRSKLYSLIRAKKMKSFNRLDIIIDLGLDSELTL